MRVVIVDDLNSANAITHGGIFHADDVFSTVLLSRFKDIKLYRALDFKSITPVDQIVFDIGCGDFDHHQIDVDKRPSGYKYASFGLLWRHLGKRYLRDFFVCEKSLIDSTFDIFDREFVEGIDVIDNGDLERECEKPKVKINTVSDIISSFNPTWDDTINSLDSCFINAVNFAQTIFDHAIKSSYSKAKAKIHVDAAIKETLSSRYSNIMILNEYMPYEQFIYEYDDHRAHNILYVVYPSKRGGYNVQAVPYKDNRFAIKLRFPLHWAGKENEELEKVSGVPGATFCHYNRFLCAAKTKEAAFSLAKKSIEDAVIMTGRL